MVIPAFLIPVEAVEKPKAVTTADFSYGASPSQIENSPKANLSESLEELDSPPKTRRRVK
jgi:hypothetical protein